MFRKPLFAALLAAIAVPAHAISFDEAYPGTIDQLSPESRALIEPLDFKTGTS